MPNTIIFAGGEMGAFVPSDNTIYEGGTEYTSNSVPLGSDYRATENVWNINPNTNVAWQADDLAGLYGVKSIA
jgi:hypothetical protein